MSRDIDLSSIAEKTEGFSGADVAAIPNTAISLVLHEFLQKYPTPQEAAKHSSDAVLSLRHFEDSLRKIKIQRGTKPREPVTSVAHYM